MGRQSCSTISRPETHAKGIFGSWKVLEKHVCSGENMTQTNALVRATSIWASLVDMVDIVMLTTMVVIRMMGDPIHHWSCIQALLGLGKAAAALVACWEISQTMYRELCVA